MSDDINPEKLLIIRNKFLCCVPVSEFGLQDLLCNISWKDQNLLIQYTTKNSLLKNYPIKISYQKIFLKTVIDILEKNSSEVHDTLYENYCDILSCEEEDRYYYKHYMINDKVITLKENKNFISEGTTGLCSWQASLALSQWCLNNKEKLRNNKILELGSGVGLVGLTVAQFCQPQEIFLTDCHPVVLSVLTENISRNLKNNIVAETFDFAREKTVKSDFSEITGQKLESDSVILAAKLKNNSRLFVLDLPWESVENQCKLLVFPDVILAADVVYDSSVFGALCGAVKFYLGQNSKCKAIFACTERNSTTLEEFLQLLTDNNFKVTNIPPPTPKHFYWSLSVPIRFFLVTTK